MSGRPRYRAFLRHAVLAVLATVAVLAAVNVAVWHAAPAFDLTANHRHSVSPGTVRALSGMAWPMTATFYVSRERPPSTADLKRDVSAKLAAIAASVPGQFQFAGARAVVDVESTSVAEGELARLGVKPLTVTTPNGTVRYFAAVRLESVGLGEPAVVQVETPERVEYEIATLALKARIGRAEPPTPEAKLAAAGGGLSITYVGGSRITGPGDDGRLPVAWAHLEKEAEELFVRIRAANPEIGARIDTDPASPLRTGLPINGTVYSHFVLVHGGRRTARIDSVTSMEGMFGLLARTAWELTLPRRKVGVFHCGDSPAFRPELHDAEARRIYLNWSPEGRLMRMLEQLGHEPVEVRATAEMGITTEIAALVVPRPSGLTPIEEYELRAYMAAGGNMLLFHGEWHIPLIDRALALNPQAQIIGELFMAGEPAGLLQVRHAGNTLSGYLAGLGLETGAGIAVSVPESLPARVLGPSRRTTSLHTAEPSLYPARAGLVPVASGVVPPHPLVQDVTALPLRGASPLILKPERLGELGLEVAELLVLPPGSLLLALDASRDGASLQYAAGGSGDGWFPETLNQGKREPEQVDAGGLPVAVMVRGQFPFDVNEAPPVDAGAGVKLSAPGNRFVRSPGQLAVVASPDALEHLDSEGGDVAGLPRSGPLVGDVYRTSEGAIRRMVANVVDSFVFGEELIEVRQSLLPTPRRVTPWSNDERMLWLGLNLGLVPAVAVLVWIGMALRRRRRPA